MNQYIPKPVDVSAIVLPKELEALTEKLAENAHEVWAAGRIAQGWTYGEKRDDVEKKHPCLVPYEQLPESEKEYDRNTAMNTLKLVVAYGYNVVKK
ncbi:MAG: hypothetical protein IKX88_00520 [Thermoguttaceae bacterium]|nr:hypothetical protein [Thermoguttaceae bacterium]MBR5757065.1 hypothetical protein [Thermoguttaceae bacterium]